MSGSLAVFKLVSPKKEKLMKEKLDTNPQQTFADLDLSDGLGQARSILHFLNYSETLNRVSYKVTHYSDTIQNRIRIYIDDIEETYSGLTHEQIANIGTGTKTVDEYQEIHHFNAVIDFENEEIYLFTNKETAKSLMKRFKRFGIIHAKRMFFNMDNIENIPELTNIWGLWEDSTGRCKKKAYFGTEVHREEGIDTKKVTSYNVTYELDDETNLHLLIMRDCRLSSNSGNIGEEELLDIYFEIKKQLGVTFES